MDFLPDTDTLSAWLIHYGSFALFGLLVLGILALPIPEESLMILAGILMYNEKLHIGSTVISAYAGSICGITVSYLLGRTAGHFVITKYGSWLGLTPERIETMHQWFERYGKWMLFFGYFIPGVRHFTGFTAGTSELEYRKFALFAYSGAVVWVSTFLSIGYFFGGYWEAVLKDIDIDIDIDSIAVLLLVLLFCYFIYKLRHKKLDS